ncbi:MAG: hypothetical protein ACFFCW_20905 [Candidatus Hodarchaeota archaeon]
MCVWVWGKSLSEIFFGSRLGEAISLGIRFKVIYYLLIGLGLPVVGLFVARERIGRIISDGLVTLGIIMIFSGSLGFFVGVAGYRSDGIIVLLLGMIPLFSGLGWKVLHRQR